MIIICSHCGALLLEAADRCSFCDAPIPEGAGAHETVHAGSAPRAEGQVSGNPHGRRSSLAPNKLSENHEPEWRREVSRRLAVYRARRGQAHHDDAQSGLPFSFEPQFEEDLEITVEENPRPAHRSSGRTRSIERVEICIQPELDFSSAPGDRARPQTALVPVASITERRVAGMLDFFFLALTYAGFIGLFRSLGGQLQIAKVDAVVFFFTFFLFYAQYFFLFTTFAGATPGMQLRGLTIVRLDGSLPETRQLLWRSIGYVLSGATFMLGFFWAFWDEDRFTWQDRMSQTYVTAAVPLSQTACFDVPASRHGLAHK